MGVKGPVNSDDAIRRLTFLINEAYFKYKILGYYACVELPLAIYDLQPSKSLYLAHLAYSAEDAAKIDELIKNGNKVFFDYLGGTPSEEVY